MGPTPSHLHATSISARGFFAPVRKQCSSGARRCSPALLPLPQRADRDVKQLNEPRLREPSPFPDGRDRRHCGDPPVFSSLELTKPLQDVNGHSKFPHLRSSKTPPPLVEDSDETNAGGRCGQAVCGLSKSLWARVRVHSDGGVHGPLIAHVPAIVGLTTPDFSLSFNRYESPRMLMVVA